VNVAHHRLREGVSQLTRALAVRGLAAIVFGVVLLVWPEISLGALVLSFGAYSVADGVIALYTAASHAPGRQRWWHALAGATGVLAGVAVWVWPDLSGLALLYVIGAWAIVVGAFELAGALFGPLGGGSRLLLVLRGLLSVGLGVVMWAQPGTGALAVIATIASFAIATGVTLISAAIQIRRRADAAPGLVSPPSVDAPA
jgi:uncharacterized membrane protein HdeD (DUF308 family)